MNIIVALVYKKPFSILADTDIVEFYPDIEEEIVYTSKIKIDKQSQAIKNLIDIYGKDSIIIRPEPGLNYRRRKLSVSFSIEGHGFIISLGSDDWKRVVKNHNKRINEAKNH